MVRKYIYIKKMSLSPENKIIENFKKNDIRTKKADLAT